jgi:hypothetical protein
MRGRAPRADQPEGRAQMAEALERRSRDLHPGKVAGLDAGRGGFRRRASGARGRADCQHGGFQNHDRIRRAIPRRRALPNQPGADRARRGVQHRRDGARGTVMRTGSRTPGLRIVGGTAYVSAGSRIVATRSEPSIQRPEPPRHNTRRPRPKPTGTESFASSARRFGERPRPQRGIGGCE